MDPDEGDKTSQYFSNLPQDTSDVFEGWWETAWQLFLKVAPETRGKIVFSRYTATREGSFEMNWEIRVVFFLTLRPDSRWQKRKT